MNILPFLATALIAAVLPAAAQGISLAVAQPVEGARVDTPMRIVVTASGAYETKSVRATIGNQALDLVFSTTAMCSRGSCWPGWQGDFDLSAFARGPLTLSIIATDAVGNVANATRSIIYDRRPMVVLQSPTQDIVASSYQVIRATCVDDDPAGCRELRAQLSYGSSLVHEAVGRGEIDIAADLSAHEGRSLNLRVFGADVAGQYSTVIERLVFVESGPHLQHVATVPAGRTAYLAVPDATVLDVDATRVLYRRVNGEVAIRDRVSGADTTIYARAVPAAAGGQLTASGAMVHGYTPSPAVVTGVFSWETGTLVELGPVDSVVSARARGRFIIWTHAGHLYRRDVLAGVTVEIAQDPGNNGNDVAADGAVAFWNHTHDVTLVRADGSVVPVAAGGTRWNVFPVTDGRDVVYLQRDPCCGPENPVTMLFRGGINSQLAPGGTTYRINDGWVVYNKPGNTGVQQAWRLGPTGDPSQLTFFSTPSVPEQVSADGRVIFHAGGRRYLATGAELLDVASSNGATWESQGRFYMALLGDVFEILPSSVVPSPLALVFPVQPVAIRSAPRQVTLTNRGNSTLGSFSLTREGPFEVVHDCPASLPAGGSCSATVTFQASVAGANEGSLLATHAAGRLEVPLAGTAEASLVTHYYRGILGREPEAGGKLYWENEATRMEALGADGNETWYAMAMGFFFSPEYLARATDATQFVRDLYRAFFNRDPDDGGLAYWTGRIDAGMPREVVLAGFIFSPEYDQFTRAIFGDTSARSEVNLVVDFYRGLLARLPDSGGFADWIARFRAAQCQGASAVAEQAELISIGFVNSQEYANRGRSNAQFVGDLYNAMLRRGGDLEGVRYWIDRLDRNMATRDTVRRAFVTSPEFAARVQAVVAQGCAA